MKGKTTLDGCQTYGDEVAIINKLAKKSVKKNKAFEASHKFKRIRINKGYLMVEINKYLADKKHYDSIDSQHCKTI